MRELINDILVIGHHNPDTDASASACAYADFLNRVGRYDRHVVGAAPGELTPQAMHVFDRAGVEPPLHIEDVSVRVGPYPYTRSMCAER